MKILKKVISAGKYIIGIVGGLAAIVAGVMIGKKVKEFIMPGKVEVGLPWWPDQEDKKAIIVSTNEGVKSVRLPLGIKTENIDSVGYGRTDILKVEVKNASIDRRSYINSNNS